MADDRKPRTALAGMFAAPVFTGAALMAFGAAADATLDEELKRLRLPPIEGLTFESDFTVFMVPGVPDGIKVLALGKLWRLSPSFAGGDGLGDYDDDFAAVVSPRRPMAGGAEPPAGLAWRERR